jgi:hypothetical protein
MRFGVTISMFQDEALPSRVVFFTERFADAITLVLFGIIAGKTLLTQRGLDKMGVAVSAAMDAKGPGKMMYAVLGEK